MARAPSGILKYLLIPALLFCLTACRQGDKPVMRQLIPAEIPAGTIFQPVSEATPFTIKPSLRILREPNDPTRGAVGVQIMITSRLQDPVRNVQAAVWLPDGVRKYTPMALIGTNLEHWDVDLTPEQPSMGIDSIIHFADFDQREEIRAAFNGAMRVKIIWDDGAVYVEVPPEAWTIEIVE